MKLIYSMTVLSSIVFSTSLLASKPSSILDWIPETQALSVEFKNLDICKFIEDLENIIDIEAKHNLDCHQKITFQFDDYPISDVFSIVFKPFSYVYVQKESGQSTLTIYKKYGNSSIEKEPTIPVEKIDFITDVQSISNIEKNDLELITIVENSPAQALPEEQVILDEATKVNETHIASNKIPRLNLDTNDLVLMDSADELQFGHLPDEIMHTTDQSEKSVISDADGE
ncbi:MAG: hypothetical protein GXP08_17510 [Gammaproteobacteria bacterium]|nr:hypothetical protein [Gammaproteobacteria bacterium]